jgi:hypothetical protein
MNIGTAIANAWMGNANQYTPGSKTIYNKIGTKTVKVGGKEYKVPTFSVTQTLSPQQQAIFNQTQSANYALGSLANQQSNFLRNYMPQKLDMSAENVNRYMNRHFDDDFNDQQDYIFTGLQNNLANQGITPGSAAYARAMEQYSNQRAQAYSTYAGNRYGQATQMMAAERDRPFNEIAALLSGSQLTPFQPASFNAPNIPTTDFAGIQANYDNAKYNGWAAQQQAKSNMLGGLFSGLGSMFALAPGISDKRAKQNVKKIGKFAGHNIYEYNYVDEEKGDPKHVGFMAQEVKKTRPDAVIKLEKGKDPALAIDYGALIYGEAGRAPDEEVANLVNSFQKEA